jgi:putative acetyltransferase
MTGLAASLSEVEIAEADPRSDEARVLVDEMNAFLTAVYPEDAFIGNVPSTPEGLATEGVFVLARLDGEAVGSGALMPVAGQDGVMEVKRMYVRDGLRGRRIGEHVLKRLEALAAARRVAKLVLLTGPRQPDALRLYERNGYSMRGPYGKLIEHPLNIFYEKTLGAGA